MRAVQKSRQLSRKLLNSNVSPHLRQGSSVAASSIKPLTSVLVANRGEIAL